MLLKQIVNAVQTDHWSCSNQSSLLFKHCKSVALTMANNVSLSLNAVPSTLVTCVSDRKLAAVLSLALISLWFWWSLIRGIRSNCKAFNDSLPFLQKALLTHDIYHQSTLICRFFIAKIKTKTKQYEFLTQPKLIVVCGRFLFAFRRTIVAWSPNIFPSLKQTQQHIKTQR